MSPQEESTQVELAATVSPMVTIPGKPIVDEWECDCAECAGGRIEHWRCCICKRGPFRYTVKSPFFIKPWLAPGGVRGIAHNVCSEPCRIAYLGVLGRVPGVNDHEPIVTRGPSPPVPRSPRAIDSD
jgi:hypothetical protein